ncbi:MarR family transcriptional regulator [Mesorhizobium sp. CAU 1741]|uniref:MarR family winged helix-turn-helix transcriptional regulator n=1 Tax=Mesorhizobium sp. CAU 1741 TaxID=3140366 RepID=UPI00325C1194
MEMDDVDRFRQSWARELPDVDTRGMAILGRALRIVGRARPEILSIMEKHGLDGGTFDVLATLRRAGPPYTMRPTEMYRSLMVTSGGLTARLNRLEAVGLIERPPAPDDGRSLLVQLTPRGRDLVETVFGQDMEIEARMLAGLSEDEQEALAALLRKLGATMFETIPAAPSR